jgi:hypothetical protein
MLHRLCSIVRLNERPGMTGLDQKVLLACILTGNLAIQFRIAKVLVQMHSNCF